MQLPASSRLSIVHDMVIHILADGNSYTSVELGVRESVLERLECLLLVEKASYDNDVISWRLKKNEET